MRYKNSSGVTKRLGEHQSSVLYYNIIRSVCVIGGMTILLGGLTNCRPLGAPVWTCFAHKQGYESAIWYHKYTKADTLLFQPLTTREICSEFNQLAHLNLISVNNSKLCDNALCWLQFTHKFGPADSRVSFIIMHYAWCQGTSLYEQCVVTMKQFVSLIGIINR